MSAIFDASLLSVEILSCNWLNHWNQDKQLILLNMKDWKINITSSQIFQEKH